MKKYFLLLAIFAVLSCSNDNDKAIPACNCTQEVQFYYLEGSTTQEGDHYSYPIENPDCDANGQTNTIDTPFNGGIIRKVTTIVCE